MLISENAIISKTCGERLHLNLIIIIRLCEIDKEYLSTLPFYELLRGKESFEDAAYMYMNCRKHRITVRSTIDLLIAQIAIENNLFLFHNDNDYTNISKLYKNLKIY